MKLAGFCTTVAPFYLISALGLLAGCGKKNVHLGRATPVPSATPHVYKLGEPRPIVLNVDQPLIVKAATITPAPKPVLRR